MSLSFRLFSAFVRYAARARPTTISGYTSPPTLSPLFVLIKHIIMCVCMWPCQLSSCEILPLQFAMALPPNAANSMAFPMNADTYISRSHPHQLHTYNGKPLGLTRIVFVSHTHTTHIYVWWLAFLKLASMPHSFQSILDN